MRVRATVLALAGIALLLSGCLEAREDPVPGEAGACPGRLAPGDVPARAPSVGGPGPVNFTVRVVDAAGTGLADVPVIAWWSDAGGGGDGGVAAFVRLRTDGDARAVVQAPPGARVHVAAGEDGWTHDGVAQAAPGTMLELAPLSADGSLQGTWEEPASPGFVEARWDPNALPWADAARLGRLESVTFVLSWSNGPQGGADFGIAVGRGDRFLYVNPDPEPSVGASTETVTFDAIDLAAEGWTEGDGLSAGPSVSTGGFAAQPIAYELAWAAAFTPDPGLVDVCAALGATAARDVTRSGP